MVREEPKHPGSADEVEGKEKGRSQKGKKKNGTQSDPKKIREDKFRGLGLKGWTVDKGALSHPESKIKKKEKTSNDRPSEGKP